MAESKFSAVKTRIRTALILVLILSIVLYLGETAIYAFICLVSLLAQWEFLSLFYPGKEKLHFKILFCGLGVFHFLLSYFLPALPLVFNICAVALISAFTALAGFVHENAWDNMKKAGLGFISFIYLPVVFSFMSKFSLMQQFLVLLIPIASDTFAYFVGIAVGKHKIWVSVSPKKSVEGCAAGLLVSILILLYFAYCQHVVTAPFPLLLLLGITLGVLAQLGDFFESALKRTVAIKDSGTLLAGHGGVLDRTDSLLFTITGFELFTLLLSVL